MKEAAEMAQVDLVALSISQHDLAECSGGRNLLDILSILAHGGGGATAGKEAMGLAGLAGWRSAYIEVSSSSDNSANAYL